ncbi:hypothetical protein V8E52_005343 [Russula decolorans]
MLHCAGTFWFRITLLPFTLWFAWSLAVTIDIAQYLANTLGDLATWVVALRSFEWTFIINISFDAADLLFNHCGLGWSWSSKPFPPNPISPPLIPRQFLDLLVKVTAFDAAHYIIQPIRPSISRPEGDTIFDENLSLVTLASCISLCARILVYSCVDVCTEFARSSAKSYSASLPRSGLHLRPAVDIHVYDRALGQTLASALPASLRGVRLAAGEEVRELGLGRDTKFTHTDGFFILMGVASILERKWKLWTDKDLD